jgi:type IV secretory pathway VirB4 component
MPSSKIAATIIERSATQLFLSNPKAQTSDYCDSLTEHELDLSLVARASALRACQKQGGSSVVARLDGGYGTQSLCSLAKPACVDELRRENGDARLPTGCRNC